MPLIIRPISTLKFQFIFGFSECLWAIFSLSSFEKFWFYVCVVLYKFWFYDTVTLSHSYPCPWGKIFFYIFYSLLYIIIMLSICFICIRLIYFDQHFQYIWSKPFLKLFGDNFLLPIQNVSSLAVHLYCVRHEMFQLCQC